MADTGLSAGVTHSPCVVVDGQIKALADQNKGFFGSAPLPSGGAVNPNDGTFRRRRLTFATQGNITPHTPLHQVRDFLSQHSGTDAVWDTLWLGGRLPGYGTAPLSSVSMSSAVGRAPLCPLTPLSPPLVSMCPPDPAARVPFAGDRRRAQGAAALPRHCGGHLLVPRHRALVHGQQALRGQDQPGQVHTITKGN